MKVEWVRITVVVDVNCIQSQLYDVTTFDAIHASLRHNAVRIDHTARNLKEDRYRGRSVGVVVDIKELWRMRQTVCRSQF